MATPKFRTSKSKKRKRRGANQSRIRPVATECPHCHELKLPHHVCSSCGYYKGEQILTTVEEEE